MIAQELGYLSLGYTAYNFGTNQNLENGLVLGICITSVALGKVGAIYGVGSEMVSATSGERTQIQSNIINNRNPLFNVYNPSLGY